MSGYRKFTVAMFAILCATLMVGLGKISDGVYSTIMVATISAFLAANVIQKKTATTTTGVSG